MVWYPCQWWRLDLLVLSFLTNFECNVLKKTNSNIACTQWMFNFLLLQLVGQYSVACLYRLMSTILSVFDDTALGEDPIITEILTQLLRYSSISDQVIQVRLYSDSYSINSQVIDLSIYSLYSRAVCFVVMWNFLHQVNEYPGYSYSIFLHSVILQTFFRATAQSLEQFFTSLAGLPWFDEVGHSLICFVGKPLLRPCGFLKAIPGFPEIVACPYSYTNIC